MELDNAIKNNGNSYTTEFRQYDPRLGRWLSLDPLMAMAPDWTPYRAFFDNPIVYTDVDGLYETKREARQARRGTSDAGYDVGEIKGEKGSFYFEATNGDGTAYAFKNKTFTIKAGAYKGGVELYEAADARGAIPIAQARVGERFKVGSYTVVPNYINGKLDHYTTSLRVTDPTTFEEAYRYDYIIGRDKLDHFIENINAYEGAANLAFGSSLHLSQWQIDYANENYASAAKGYLKEQWSNPFVIITAAMGAFPSRIPVGDKVSFNRGGYKYTVRSHGPDANAPVGTNSASGNVYRVSRQKLRRVNRQGTGLEYLDIHGVWHHESTLKATFRDGRPNPNYNAAAANDTHIPNINVYR